MDRIVAYCGLVCSDCPAYIATQANDAAQFTKAVYHKEIINAFGIRLPFANGLDRLKRRHAAAQRQVLGGHQATGAVIRV